MGCPKTLYLSGCSGLKNYLGQQRLFNLVWLSMESKKDVNFSTVLDFGLTSTLWTFVGTRYWRDLRTKLELIIEELLTNSEHRFLRRNSNDWTTLPTALSQDAFTVVSMSATPRFFCYRKWHNTVFTCSSTGILFVPCFWRYIFLAETVEQHPLKLSMNTFSYFVLYLLFT